MTLTLQELSDRAELHALVVEYANAIDNRAWDRLDQVFTADAYIDYRALGGIDGRYPQIREWLPQALHSFPGYLHLVGNCAFEISGDRATGQVACFNPMVVPRPQGGGSDTMFLGLWYLDRYLRTPAGWRMVERVERKCFEHGMPQWMKEMLKLE